MARTTTVWADIRCSWCWMGHRRLVAAVGTADVPVEYRSFLLEPSGPAERRRTVRQTALRSWGMSEAEFDALRDRIQAAGRRDGLVINVDTMRAIDSRPAHRLLKLAVRRGADPHRAWNEAYAAHLEANVDLEQPQALRRLGVRMGLDADEVDRLLASDDLLDEVLADHHDALAMGIQGVPTVVHGDRVLAGSRSVEELAAMLGLAGAREVHQ